MSLIECLPQINSLNRDTAIIVITSLFIIAVSLLIFRVIENNKLKKSLGIDSF